MLPKRKTMKNPNDADIPAHAVNVPRIDGSLELNTIVNCRSNHFFFSMNYLAIFHQCILLLGPLLNRYPVQVKSTQCRYVLSYEQNTVISMQQYEVNLQQIMLVCGHMAQSSNQKKYYQWAGICIEYFLKMIGINSCMMFDHPSYSYQSMTPDLLL